MGGHKCAVQCLSVDWARMRVLSGSEDKTLRVWYLDRKAFLQELNPAHGGSPGTIPVPHADMVWCRRLVFSDCHQRQWRRQFASLGSRNRLLPEAVAGAQFFGAMCFLLAGMSSWKNLPNIRQVGLLMDAECLKKRA